MPAVDDRARSPDDVDDLMVHRSTGLMGSFHHPQVLKVVLVPPPHRSIPPPRPRPVSYRFRSVPPDQSSPVGTMAPGPASSPALQKNRRSPEGRRGQGGRAFCAGAARRRRAGGQFGQDEEMTREQAMIGGITMIHSSYAAGEGRMANRSLAMLMTLTLTHIQPTFTDIIEDIEVTLSGDIVGLQGLMQTLSDIVGIWSTFTVTIR